MSLDQASLTNDMSWVSGVFVNDNKDTNNTENENENVNVNIKSKKYSLLMPGFVERINPSPIQVVGEMPLNKIYTLFHILKPHNIYVEKYSRLIGVINDFNLIKR